MAGWAETVLDVDLSRGTLHRVPLETSLREKYLGGRGINSRLLYDHTGPGTDPLAEDNVVIFGSGPVAGTVAPSCPRCTVTAKSPLTGILGDANFGGFFSPAMKKAGLDHIILRGRAERPVVLVVNDGSANLMDAMHLWGKSIPETDAALKREFGEKAQIAAIGPAGENMVYMACVVHRFNAAGRTGMGAVMGSKNLKAVCVIGTGKVPVADPDRFAEARKIWKQKIDENPFTKFFGEFGSAGPLDREEEAGILTARNFSRTGEFENVSLVSAGNLKKYLTRSHACFCCPVHCIQSFEVTDGAYKGTRGTKMPEGCNSACGPTCGNTDPGSLFMMNNLANQNGLDILDFGLLTAIAMDWYEHGIINDTDTDGISLDWGNHESMIRLLKKICLREGIGNILADGAYKAAQTIGRDAEQYISHCKGMVFGGVDPRVLRGSALCYATGTRGGDHLRGGILVELPSANGTSALSEEEAIEKYGTADVLKPTSYNKQTAANYNQDMYTIADCLEVCKFITAHNGHGIVMQDMADMLCAVTGLQLSINDLRTIANRVFTLERAYLVREGIDKKDDFLEGKWTRGPVPGGKYSGEAVDRREWDAMLERYYTTRGWDPATGIPLRETLDQLGLHDIAEDLQALGRLPESP